jgi:hypothetical protein
MLQINCSSEKRLCLSGETLKRQGKPQLLLRVMRRKVEFLPQVRDTWLQIGALALDL